MKPTSVVKVGNQSKNRWKPEIDGQLNHKHVVVHLCLLCLTCKRALMCKDRARNYLRCASGQIRRMYTTASMFYGFFTTMLPDIGSWTARGQLRGSICWVSFPTFGKGTYPPQIWRTPNNSLSPFQ